jgi:hypothetical protein
LCPPRKWSALPWWWNGKRRGTPSSCSTPCSLLVKSCLIPRLTTPRSRSSCTPSWSSRGKYIITLSHTRWRSWCPSLSVRWSKTRMPRGESQSGHSSWWVRPFHTLLKQPSNPRCWLISLRNGLRSKCRQRHRPSVLNDVLWLVADEERHWRGASLRLPP